METILITEGFFFSLFCQESVEANFSCSVFFPFRPLSASKMGGFLCFISISYKVYLQTSTHFLNCTSVGLEKITVTRCSIYLWPGKVLDLTKEANRNVQIDPSHHLDFLELNQSLIIIRVIHAEAEVLVFLIISP